MLFITITAVTVQQPRLVYVGTSFQITMYEDYGLVIEVPRSHTCDEEIVCMPYDKGTLNIQGDRKDSRSSSRLAVISCTKIPKLIEKGCYLFLARISEERKKDALKMCLHFATFQMYSRRFAGNPSY